MFLYIAIGDWNPFTTQQSGRSLANNTLTTYLLICSTVALVGAKNVVSGFADINLNLSSVTRSLCRETNAFWFNLAICFGVGNPILNHAKEIEIFI